MSRSEIKAMDQMYFSRFTKTGMAINTACKLTIYLTVFMIAMLFCGCKKTVAVEVDQTTPPAITRLVNEMIHNNPTCDCHPCLDHYIWKNINAYVVAINDALNIGYVCDWIPVVYDSNGKQVLLQPGYTFVKLQSEGKFIGNVWTCR